jgi:phosphinothricin acetyltransferase
MEAVVASAAQGGIWSIQAGMFPENTASVALHESLGFRLVGRFERIAQLDGVWRDTILLELRLP